MERALRSHVDCNEGSDGEQAKDKIRAMFEGKGSSTTALYEDGDDLIGKLERLARLRSDGVLNEEEFQKAKSRIID